MVRGRKIIDLLYFGFLIIICVMFIVFHLRKHIEPNEGIDAYGIRWNYNKDTATLMLEATKSTYHGAMMDYVEPGDCSGVGDEGLTEEEYDAVCEARWAPWYRYSKKCKKIVIGRGIQRIGNYTCYQFTNLSEIEWAGPVQRIGAHAFQGCNSLKQVSFPQTLIEIEEYAFCESSVRTVSFPDGLQKIGAYSFQGCSNLKNVSFPKTLVEIERYGFYESALQKVIFTDGLKNIGGHAFQGAKLKEVVLPDSTEYVLTEAFANCKKLERISLPASVKYLGTDFLNGANKLSKVRMAQFEKRYVEDMAFNGINGEVIVEVPKEKYDEYKEMLYTHGLPETAKVVAY